MRFGSPQWLWVLISIPVIYWLMAWDESRRQKQFARFADRNVWSLIVPELNWRGRLKKAKLWLLAAMFLILAMARPQWGTHEEVVKMTGLDIIVVLDVSNSMEVEDVVPSRLKKAKHLIRNMVDRLRGDRVGAVAFAGSSYVACPLTTDLEYLLESVDLLTPKSVTNQGTDIGISLETASRALDRAAEESVTGSTAASKTTEKPPASRVVVLLSDGEDHEEQALTAAQKLKASGTKFYILGIGTEKGGPVPVRDEAGTLRGYKRDSKGQPVLSTFKPEFLVSLAAAGGGRYWTASSEESEIDELLQDVGALNRTDYAERRFLIYEDRFQFPLAVAILLILFELAVPTRKTVIRMLGVLLVFSVYEAHASPVDTYLENEKGLRSFKEGKMDEAKKNFGAAQARDPSLPELEFNQGVIRLREGDMDAANRSFQSSSRMAIERGNSGLAGRSLYNLGVGLTKKGDMTGALQSYLGAIDLAQKSKDQELEQAARKNIELLRQEQQKQKQQQKQDEQDKKEDQKKEQGKDGQGGDQKKQDSKGGQDKQKEDNPGQQSQNSKIQQHQKQTKFRSLKLNREDADRVMAELKEKEKQLEGKLKKQNGNSQHNPKDW